MSCPECPSLILRNPGYGMHALNLLERPGRNIIEAMKGKTYCEHMLVPKLSILLSPHMLSTKYRQEEPWEIMRLCKSDQGVITIHFYAPDAP
jgi:hypothetical protein